MEEIWKDIIGFEGIYQVSNFGRIKSLSHLRMGKSSEYLTKEKILKLQITTTGYNQILTRNSGKRVWFNVHRTIAEAFIPNPESKLFVNHINGIKTDNRVENLEWVTKIENAIHAVKIGLIKSGEKSLKCKLEMDDVYDMKIVRSLFGWPYKTIGKKFNVGEVTAYNAINNKSYKSHPINL